MNHKFINTSARAVFSPESMAAKSHDAWSHNGDEVLSTLVLYMFTLLEYVEQLRWNRGNVRTLFTLYIWQGFDFCEFH